MKRISLAVLAVLLLSVFGWCQEPVQFGAIPVGTTVTATYTFRNSNPFDCTLEAVGFGEGFVQAMGPFALQELVLPQSLPAGGSAQWIVTFRPLAGTHYQEQMWIRVRCGILSQTLTANVSGQGSGTGGETSGIGPTIIDLTQPGTVLPEGCACATEIGQVLASLSALTFAVQGDLSATVRRIDTEVQEIQTEIVALQLVSVEPIALDDIHPGPFPTQGGARFRDFVDAHRRLVLQAAEILPLIDAEEPSQQAVLEAGSRVLLDLTIELDQVREIVEQLPVSQQQRFDSYIPPGTTPYLDSVYTVASDPANHPKLKALMANSGTDTAQTVWNKLRIWVGHIPAVGGVLESLMDDISELTASGGDALAVAGMLFQYELEKKLDGIIRGLFGIEIPPTATETQLQELLRRIPTNAFGDRLGRIESGVTANAARLEGLAAEAELIKVKVDSLASQLGVALRGVRFEVEPDLPQPPYSGPDYGRSSVLDQIELLRLKLDNLGRILGLSLYGPEMGFPQGFDIEPPDPHSTTPLGAGPGYDAIKPEIKAIEEELRRLREDLERLIPGDGPLPGDPEPPHNGNGNGNGGPPPPFDEYVNRQLALTKKIYVYDEGVLGAASADDHRVILVKTAAFDLAGWVDLTELRDGDEIQVSVEVSVADGPFRLWSKGVFQDAQTRGLKYFTEFANGLQEVVGTDVRLTIAQTRSADNYATAIPIYYQFIVESQD